MEACNQMRTLLCPPEHNAQSYIHYYIGIIVSSLKLFVFVGKLHL